MMKPYKIYAIAVISGVIASLALPPIGFIPGLFALSIPILILGQAATPHALSKGQAFILGWATGTGWFIFSIYWVSNALVTAGGLNFLLIPFVSLGLPLFLGLFWAAAFWACFVLARWFNLLQPSRLLLLIILLSGTEYLRGYILTGFPWNAPGLVAANAPLGLAASAFFGYWGMTVLVLIFAIIPAMLMMRMRVVVVIALAGFTTAAALATVHLQQIPFANNAAGMMVRLVQPNLSQDDKWNWSLRPQHLAGMINASRQPSSLTAHPLDLIVWPETAFAGTLEHEPQAFKAATHAATAGKSSLLTGVIRLASTPFALSNAAVIVAPNGDITGSVSKSHLVPFGEYAPFRDYIPFVDVIAGVYDFASGQAGQAMEMSRRDGRVVRILPLICYEVIFPSAVRRHLVNTNADVMVVITNDAWFGDSIGPRQHLAMAQMRSAELGTAMIRVANTGVSAMINSHGAVTAIIPYGEQGFVDADVGGSLNTITRQYGDLLFVILQFILLFGVVFVQVSKKKSTAVTS